MPAKTTWPRWCSAARRSAAPVKSPTSTKHTSGSCGRSFMAPFSVRPPVHSTTVSSPWAASTELATPAHGGGQARAVGHVRVVTGVLDHHRLGFTWYEGAFVHLEADPSAT